MSRKTVDVLKVLEWGNQQLRRTDEYATVEYKVGICGAIEMVLHESDNYAGFMFHDNADSDTGTLGYYSRSYFYSAKMRKEVGGHMGMLKRRAS
tara:strand:- start:407 stop:688 length:282 start_codon:yes stop_codon:yes gene_type:complete